MELKTSIIESRSEWNRLVLSCSDFNSYSSFEWGEYKRNKWRIRRWAFHRDNGLVGVVQLLSKRRFGVTVGWAPGGVALVDWGSFEEVLAALQQVLGPGPFVLRISLSVEATSEREFDLSLIDQLTPARKATRLGFSVRFDLDGDSNVVERMSPHHRRAYRKSIKNGLKFERTEVLSREFVALSRAMSELKRRPRIGIPLEDIERVAKNFGNHMKMYSVIHERDRVAACLVMRFGPHAFYYLAASNPRGRRVRASYFMVKSLFEQLRTEGVRYLDLGGVSPIKGYADGVTYFKKGFSGRLVRHLGDYDLSNNPLLRFFFNSIVGGRFPR